MPADPPNSPNRSSFISHTGLVPLMDLAEQAGLSALLGEHFRFTSERVKSGAARACSV